MPSWTRHPVSRGAVTALVLGAFYYATGNLFAEEAPRSWMSARALTGMSLMLIFLPAYILTANLLCLRRSVALIEELRPLVPDAAQVDRAIASIREAVRNNWKPALLGGVALGALNAATPLEILERQALMHDIPMALGQYILWTAVAIAATVRFAAARRFRELGEVVELDLFRIDKMRPIAHSGLVDVVLVAGGIALTPLQSLDAEFRWENYRFPVLLLVPATVLLMMWPLRPIHRRLGIEKQRLLDAANSLVEKAGSATSAEQAIQLEALLAYRERVRDQRTWPLDVPLLSRFAFYIVIPLIAWIGAALVEMAIERVAAG